MRRKSILSLLLAVVFLVSLALPVGAAESGTCGDGLTWKLENDILTISGTGPMADYSAEEPAPWSGLRFTTAVISSGVTSIGDYAFYEAELMYRVEIPETVKTIGAYAFSHCTGLRELDMAEGVETIGAYAFEYCTALIGLVLPDSVATIETFAFSYCTGMVNADLGTGLRELGVSAFASSSNLVSVALPEGLTTVPTRAFYWTYLRSITLPASLTSIGDSAFNTRVNTSNVYYGGTEEMWAAVEIGSGNTYIDGTATSPATIHYNGLRTLYSGTCGDSLTWTITSDYTLTISGSGAMPDYTAASEQPWYNHTIYHIVLEEGVTSVGAYAFSGLKNVTDVVLSERVTSIGNYGFYSCTQLANINLGERITSIGEYAFSGCNLKGTLTVPYRVTSIGSGAFGSNKRLTRVELSERMTAIPDRAFTSCYNLKEIVIPEKISSIGVNAFYNCSELTDIYYGGTEDDWSAVTVDSGNSTYLSNAAMHYSWADGVSTGTCGEELSWSMDSDGVLTISGTGSMADYTAEEPAPWSGETVTAVVIEAGVTSIGANAFSGCEALTEAEIPESVVSVGADAFSGCAGLTAVNYAGTEVQWAAVAMGSGNESLTNTALTAEYGFIVDSGTNWMLDADGTLTLSGTGSVSNSSWAVWREDVRHVVIGSGYTSISASAFSGFSALESVEIPDTVTAINGSAFYNCDSLVSVTVPGTLATLAASAFRDCDSLEEVVFADGTAAIGNYLFYDCDSLVSVTFGSGYTGIGDYVFQNCPALTTVTIPDSVTSIGTRAFESCSSLENVTIPEDLTALGTYAFYGCSSLKSVVLPDTLTSISNYCFNGCASLEQVTIPDSITSIGTYAFQNCKRLKSLEIPDSVTSIGNYAFRYCYDLESVVIPDSVTSLGTYAFSNCTNLRSVTIPDSLTAIPEYAFESCIWLQEVKIPDTVTTIGAYAFYQCSSLEGITIPDSVTSIEGHAFEYAGLKDLTIPASVTSIGSCAFRYCDDLKCVMIYKGVTTIESYAFYSCSQLTDVYYSGTSSDWSTVTKDDYALSATVHYNVVYENGLVSGTCGTKATWSYDPETNILTISGTGAMNAYTSSALAPWQGVGTITQVVIEEGVTSIGDYAFYNMTDLTSVTMADSVTSIGIYAFRGATALTAVSVPDSVTEIGNFAFAYCSALTEVKLGSGLTSLGKYAFAYCTALEELVIPDRVTTLGACIVRECTSIKRVVLPESATLIDSYFFGNCYKLKEVTIPASVTAISDYAFNNCLTLADIYYGGTEDSWAAITVGTNNTCLNYGRVHYLGATTASGTCGDSLSWELSDDGVLTIVGQGAMYHYASFEEAPWSAWADQITTVFIGQKVTSVGSFAFEGCGNLTAVNYGGTEEQWASVTVGVGNEALSGAALTCGYLDVVHSGSAGTSATWSLTSDGTLILSGEGTVKSFSFATIGPTYVLDKPWSGQSSKICRIIVEEGITSLPAYALSSTAAVSISLPSTLTSMGNYCCEYSRNLPEITIPSGMKTVPYGCFQNCGSLTTVNLPETLTSVSSYAFSDCTSLTDIDLPDSVTNIYGGAFRNCTGLERIYIPATVTTFGTNPFNNCTALNTVFYGGTRENWETLAISVNEATVHCGVTVMDGCGQQVIHCPECEVDFTLDNSPVISHSWDAGTVTTEPTCTEAGERTYTCANGCGLTKTETIDALGHTEQILPGHEATCTEDGLSEGKSCSVCGEVLTAQEEIEALGHDEVTDAGFEPTCTETGLTDGVHCGRCGEVLTAQEVIGAKGHSYSSEVLAPTCTEEGCTVYTCSACGHSYVGDVTAALGHTYGEWTTVTAATCSAEGEERRACAYCDAYETRTLEMLSHTPGAEVREKEVAPDCENAGSYDLAVYCETCGAELSRNHFTIDALGHAWAEETVVTAPTCIAQGYTTHTCTRCGETMADTYVGALGHSYEGGVCVRCGAAEPVKANPFTDVPDDAYYTDAVLWAVDRGITAGYGSNTTFKPDQDCTRAQVVTFLWRAAGSPEPTSEVNPFTDVDASAWYYKAVLWAVEKDITAGYGSNTTFKPDQECTRAQVVTFLWRYVGSPEPASGVNPFTDVSGSAWYYKAVLWAVENGVTAGYGTSGTIFAPDMVCSRAQIVTFLYRAVG